MIKTRDLKEEIDINRQHGINAETEQLNSPLTKHSDGEDRPQLLNDSDSMHPHAFKYVHRLDEIAGLDIVEE